MEISFRHRFRLLLPLLALLAALLLAACGDDEGSGPGGGPDPTTATPADAPIYIDAVVRPEGEQRDGLNAALQKLTGEDDPGAAIRAELDESLADQGLSYEEDVEPWLGQRAGLFLTEFSGEDGEGAAVISVTDGDAARETVKGVADGAGEQASYAGVDYMLDDGNAVGIVGDFLVTGTEKGFQDAVDASAGDSLADDSAKAEALDSAPSESIFRGLVDSEAVIDLLLESGQISEQDLEAAEEQLQQLGGEPVVFSGAASSDALSFEASGPATEGAAEGTEIVSSFPADAWLALGVPMIGETVGAAFESLSAGLKSSAETGALPPGVEVPDLAAELEQSLGLDLSKDLAWAGDGGLFLAGNSPLTIGGGLVIETDDEEAAAAALEKVRRRLSREPGVQARKTEDGFQLQGVAGAPVGAEVAIRDGRVVVALAGVTPDDVLDPPETLESTEAFSEATDALDGASPTLYVDFPPIVDLLKSTGQAADPQLQQALPVLEALTYLVAGVSVDGDRSIGRLVLGLQDPGSGSGAAAAITP